MGSMMTTMTRTIEWSNYRRTSVADEPNDDMPETLMPMGLILHILSMYRERIAALPDVHQAIIIVQLKGEKKGLIHEVQLCDTEAHMNLFMEQLAEVPAMVRDAVRQATEAGIGPLARPAPGEHKH